MVTATAVRKKRHPGERVPPLGKKWWENFRARHKNILSMRRPDNLDRARAQCATRPTVDQFFTILETTLEESGLREKPRQIYNCDESGFQLEKGRHKVLAQRGAPHVYRQALGTRDHVSVLACFNAAGEDVPPMIIFKGGFPAARDFDQGAPRDTIFARTKAGYITGEVFRKWFQHFLQHAAQERPLLLIFDGHQSHLDPEVIKMAEREDVILLCLPPHCSHVLQPLDVGYFGPLKAEFAKVAGDLSQYRHSYIVNKAEFAKVFRYPYQRCKDRNLVVKGFRECGIFPFNPSAVDGSRLMPLDSQPGPSTASPGEGSTSTPIAESSTIGTSSPGATGSCTCTCSIHRQPAPEEHPLVAGGLIPRDLAATLPPIRSRPRDIRRFPVAARVITGEEYRRQILERAERERAEEAARQRRAALRQQRLEDRAAIDRTIEGVVAAAGTTPNTGNTTSHTLREDSLGSPAVEAGHMPAPPAIPSPAPQPTLIQSTPLATLLPLLATPSPGCTAPPEEKVVNTLKIPKG